jgi:hypothetical protein
VDGDVHASAGAKVIVGELGDERIGIFEGVFGDRLSLLVRSLFLVETYTGVLATCFMRVNIYLFFRATRSSMTSARRSPELLSAPGARTAYATCQ